MNVSKLKIRYFLVPLWNFKSNFLKKERVFLKNG